jgi:uncharacterized membrane protein
MSPKTTIVLISPRMEQLLVAVAVVVLVVVEAPLVVVEEVLVVELVVELAVLRRSWMVSLPIP